MLNYCPELERKAHPKDRDFFFNILNTIEVNIVDRMLHNAIKKRNQKSKIENEIKVIPELRDIFTDEFTLIGQKGRTIKELRIEHHKKPWKYAERKKYKIEI